NPTGMGAVDATVNGVAVSHYRGELGYNDAIGPYWKMGIYRAAMSNTLAVDYDNVTITDITSSAPGKAAAASIASGSLGYTFVSQTDNGVMAGSAGVDTANFVGAQSAITVNLGVSTTQNTAGGGLQTITSVEN